MIINMYDPLQIFANQQNPRLALELQSPGILYLKK